MKMKRNWLVATVLMILLVSLTAPLVALPTSALDDDKEEIQIEDIEAQWKILKTDIITVLFPRNGRKPMFLWWYTKEDPIKNIYVVKYQGLIEYFAFNKLPYPEYYRRMHEALADRLRETYIAQKEEEYGNMGEEGMMRLGLLQTLWMEIFENWEDLHAPMLRFDAAKWELTDISNITASDGKIIGVAFAFNLVAVPYQPHFDFAVNNVMIKVRFYNTTVEENVPGTDISYKVQAGEMKMDLVINKWKWNIDVLRPLILKLKEYGIDIPEGKTRLALWVNLASINLEKLQVVEHEPDEIETVEEHPEDLTASHMDVEGVGYMSIEQNQTLMQGEEGQERPISVERPWWAPWQPREKSEIRLKFATQDKTLLGFFRFVSEAKVTTPKNETSQVPVRASYIAAGHHLRLFLGYPYFGNSTLEHDPSIGVDVPGLDTTPKYSLQAPSGSEVTPVVLGKYVLPLFTTQLMVALIAIVSATAIILYATKWKRKTPVNMVGAGTTG